MGKKEYHNQLEKVYLAFKEAPKTRLQVALETNIYRANVCYYVRDLRQADRIAVYKKGIDPITRHEAEFLTTDPDLFPQENQMELFKNKKAL